MNYVLCFKDGATANVKELSEPDSIYTGWVVR